MGRGSGQGHSGGMTLPVNAGVNGDTVAKAPRRITPQAVVDDDVATGSPGRRARQPSAKALDAVPDKRARMDDTPRNGHRARDDPFLLELRAFFQEKLDGRVLVIPKFCRHPLDLGHVYREVVARGGYKAVCDTRRWKEVCATLGHDLTGQTSAGFQMRQNYERCLLEYEFAEHGRSLELVQDAIANNREWAAKWNRTRPGDTGRGPAPDAGLGPTPPLVNLNLDKARLNAAYNMDDADERKIAHTLGLYDAIEPFELSFLFPGADLGVYITVRNSVLCRWRANPNAYVSVEQACSWFMPKHQAVVHCAHRFLTVAGYINFGVGFTGNYPAPGEAKGTVVVVGAGFAGLAAARHLQCLGHRCVVVEARDRAGGRVWTERLEGIDPDTNERVVAACEMGGSVLTGADGNPIAVIAKQMALPFWKIRDECPLYLEDGEPVDADTDKRVFREFEDCMNEVGEKRNQLTETDEHGADHLSLGRELERTWAEKARAGNKPQIETDLFNWHLANLEFANAGRLEVLSLGQWDQDDPYDFDGDHVWLPGGNVRLVSAMARELPIFYGHAVTHVEYPAGSSAEPVKDREGRAHEGVLVTCKNGREFRADAALVTVPLGVLKKGSVQFEPPLPERKSRAIDALGFGVLDKVILLFPKPFWDMSVDTFGYVTRGDRDRRGRYFMFYNYAKTDEHDLSGGAVLIALVSGEAALEFERSGVANAVAETMTVLRRIYERRGVTIPDPIDSKCACWGADEFAYGSYSNISVGATGEDYDALAEPVGDGLYFAGEATMRRHPATMHGAFLSGMREAARISEKMRELNKAGKLAR